MRPEPIAQHKPKNFVSPLLTIARVHKSIKAESLERSCFHVLCNKIKERQDFFPLTYFCRGLMVQWPANRHQMTDQRAEKDCLRVYMPFYSCTTIKKPVLMCLPKPRVRICDEVLLFQFLFSRSILDWNDFSLFFFDLLWHVCCYVQLHNRFTFAKWWWSRELCCGRRSPNNRHF